MNKQLSIEVDTSGVRPPYIEPTATVHKTLDKTDGRIIIVGDIHGCYEEFILLLQQANFTEEDTCIVVGDLMNKGPDSLKVIRYCKQQPNILCIKGNHEDYTLLHHNLAEKFALEHAYPQFTEHDLKLLKAKYYTEECAELGWAIDLTLDDIEYLRDMPFTITIPQYKSIVVHAGLLPYTDIDDQPPGLMYRMRNIELVQDVNDVATFIPHERDTAGDAWIKYWIGPDHVYFGHDATRKYQHSEFATGLDTGCCYGGSLTAVILPGKEVVQVESLQPKMY
eukprot:TRINITY_DN1052_c0_g1_i1.p1 TRINITY_DN1052_c0_g1~~TRINITY_DN1052_c0_g1_i1.p1  ORF type:complete len:280 (-),score=55.13 TRINITY_DN1052_c0_g1_i1:468-1307(-)